LPPTGSSDPVIPIAFDGGTDQIMESTVEISTLLDRTFDQGAIDALKANAFASSESLNTFLESLHGLEAKVESGQASVQNEALKLGVCYLFLSDAKKAMEWLGKAPASGTRSYYLAQAYRDSKRLTEAAAEFEKAAGGGANKIECESLRAECLLAAGQTDAAAKIVDGLGGQGAGSAVWNVVKGRLFEARGDLSKAAESYEKAISIDGNHPLAMFHLAYLADVHGDDEQALELYERCASQPGVYAHALINLAIIYEDKGTYDKAAACLRRVLAVNPSHKRAELYLKDVLAAGNMYIDEHQLKAIEKHSAVLDIPVSDFELSVRSRNCLKKMNINTLGDLLKISEPELLAYKNFGETSLKEIKAMLVQKGLSLGMHAPASSELPALPVAESDPALAGMNPDILNRSVATMELSVRSRKCLQRLGINTIGELAMRSERELLDSRNFGQTSLDEIGARLADLGLSLRPSQ
jgi:DNA-directed RNA polymerase subunit alpha